METMIEYSIPEGFKQYVKLCDKSIDQKSPSNSTPGIGSDKSHKKTEAHQHHHIDILKGWISGVV